MTTLTTHLRENRSPSSSGPLPVVMVSRQPWAVVILIHYLGRQQHTRGTLTWLYEVYIDMLGDYAILMWFRIYVMHNNGYRTL